MYQIFFNIGLTVSLCLLSFSVFYFLLTLSPSRCLDDSLAAPFLSPAECNQQTPLVVTFTRTFFPPLSSLFFTLPTSLSSDCTLPTVSTYKSVQMNSCSPWCDTSRSKLTFIQQTDCKRREKGGRKRG